MPTRSRNARTKARQKRTMSLLKRSLKQAAFEANRNFSTVLMLLAQQGGEALVSSETIRSVIPTLGKASYQTEQTDAGVRIYVVANEPAAAVDEGPQTLTTEQIAELKARLDARGLSMPAAESTEQPVDPTIAAEDPA